MNSASPTSSAGFNVLAAAGRMRYACPSMESIRARLPGGPAKYQVRPVQTKATNNASVAAAKDNLAKLHWKPRAPDSIRQLTLAAPPTSRPDAYERHEAHSRR